ncbi:MAG TPA: hypothetical protein VIM19_00390 [Actinomycetes bacterium]
MRGNGLTAASYVAITDLDADAADAALAALRDAGIAAYVTPLPRTAPGTPLDRLHVDAGAEGRARALVGADRPSPLSSPREPDIEALFASIVADYDAPAIDPVPSWPVSEDLWDAGAAHREPPSSGDDGWPEVPTAEPAGVRAEEERYVPPPPPPLPETTPATRFAWAGALGGPAAFVLATLLGWQLDGWVLLVAAVAFLAGFGYLVSRLKDRDTDDPDDGAVV